MKLKDLDYRVLSELIKNAKISDRALAEKLGVSQPTVTRRRARLEQEGLMEYTAIPNLKKLGFEIMAFSFSKWTSKAFTEVLPSEKFAEEIKRFFSAHPNVIFGTTGGSGLKGMNSASISIHKDYADYYNWVREIKSVWGKYVAEFESFIFCLGSDYVARHITFKHLADYLKESM